jgi:K+-transporting ATPase KdpF subunit
MTALYAICTLIAVGLVVYLVWALFRPEDFS